MQHTATTSNGASNNEKLRDLIAARSQSTAKSQTADLSNIRSYKEHLVATKMTAQEKWEQTKQTEVDVQTWELNQKRKENEKKIEEALKQKCLDEKKKELIDQLNINNRKKYHQLLKEVKQNPARNNTSDVQEDN
jgi:vacuolar-type H+-ATPase subunit I/STV1